jgi:two-component system sensor histidine kinase/response regulator
MSLTVSPTKGTNFIDETLRSRQQTKKRAAAIGAGGVSIVTPLPSIAATEWSANLTFEALGNLAHELRTPIQVLLGNLEILQDEYAHAIGQAPRAMLGRMNASAFELKQTLDNLISFVLAKAGGENDIDEDLTVESILADIGPGLQAANGDKLELRFDFKDAPTVIRAPRRAVTAMIMNLALNAIKFTESGSVKIAIRRARDLTNGDAVEIEVSDSGPGLSPALLAALSQPFAQLSRSSRRRYRGVGLGLSVVQSNVVMLGGSIRLLPTPGQGATFLVRLPSRSRRIEIGAQHRRELLPTPGAPEPAAQVSLAVLARWRRS